MSTTTGTTPTIEPTFDAPAMTAKARLSCFPILSRRRSRWTKGNSYEIAA